MNVARRFEPPTSPPVRGRDLALEGVRGFCALAVFYAHLFMPQRVLDPRWSPSPKFWWFNLGYPAVLMFFVLSGYVIGLTVTGPATGAAIRHYLTNRAARLLPMNTIAVALSCLLLADVTWRLFLGNLFLLQNEEPYPLLGQIPLLANNPNLWSLNYELVYYLVFVALWRFRPPVIAVVGGLLLVVSAYCVGLPVTEFFARYACGALYWLAGLSVAWMTTSPTTEPRSNWPSAVLVAFALWVFAPLRGLVFDWGLFGWTWLSAVSPHRLDYLPVCVWVLLAVTGRAPRLASSLRTICLVLATAGLIARAVSGTWGGADWCGTTALAAAWALGWQTRSVAFLRWFAPLGGISFALYVIAAPIQLGQRAILPSFAGSAQTFSVRLVAVVAVVMIVAWILERKICPWFGRRIRALAQ